MASIGTNKQGRRRILFVDDDGKRQTIWLGKVSESSAQDIKLRVEGILQARLLNRSLDPSVAKWLRDLKPKMAAKLARVGLIEAPGAKGANKLGPFLVSYFTKRTDVKESTSTNWQHTRRCLLSFFGEGRALATITAGEAADFERWLQT